MYHLVYVSYATKSFSEEELIELLKDARLHNKIKEITGLLLYSSNRFIQALEGDEKEVKELLETIKSDPRHKKVTVVLEGESRERIFENWSMGFKNLSSEQFLELAGFRDPGEFAGKPDGEAPIPVLVFLRLFYKKNFIDYLN